MKNRLKEIILDKKLIDSRINLIGILATMVVSIVFAMFLCNKSMPLAEGWYDYYARKMNEGCKVYEDFEYLFTPFYITFIAGFVKVFGESIIFMRILGVAVFTTIAVIIYLIMKQCFSISASVFAALTGVFYLQSEVYSVFYDYVRFMDIFSYLSILFMIYAVKKWISGDKEKIYTILWGVFSSLFVLVKQNMGLIYVAFSLIFLIACLLYLHFNIKDIAKKTGTYLISCIVPVILTFIVIYFVSDLSLFLNSTLFGATEAKGGMSAILFNWIINGKDFFLMYFFEAICAVMLLVIAYRISSENKKDEKINYIIFIAGYLAIFIGVLCVLYSRKIGERFSQIKSVDVYLIFLIQFILLILLAVVFIIELIKGTNKYKKYLPFFAILGAFFAISYGAGTSGGLSVGESALGVSLLVCLFYDCIKSKIGIIIRVGVIFGCVYFSMRNIGYKMVYPCMWWGIDSMSLYDCTEKTDIEKLKGIKVSKSEKELYEGIVDIIQEYTEKDDSIYCFPFIPLFYCLSDRDDPGVFAKVQWFDVSTNESVINDIEVIRESKPKVILIYNLNESTYYGHESSFNLGEVSGTRKMRDFLYEFVYTNSYRYIDNFVSGNNNISVFVYDDGDENKALQGNGTQQDPYLINSRQDLVNLSMTSNRCRFDTKVYYKLNSDIYLNDIIWIPINYYQYNENIIFDINNYTVYNINLDNNRYSLGQDIMIQN